VSLELGHSRPIASREGPPRLILRFAVSLALALALAAAAILLVVRHFNTIQAERAATSQARVIASSVLSASLRQSDFANAVEGTRRSELDALFARHVLEKGVLRVDVYAADGTMTYSTNHRLVGTKADEPAHVHEALSGTVRGDVTTIRSTSTAASGQKVLRTYAPVAVTGGTGVVAIFQDYAPIARSANATFFPVAGIFEAALVALFIILLPILSRVTARIRRQMDEIERHAYYDDLTGLPNRTLFRDRLEQALFAATRESESVSVVVFDVDRFKEVNDALGHETGDILLQELATRLRSELRAPETLARFGGDELGLLLPGASAEDAVEAAARVHATLHAPFTLSGLPLEVAVSAGVATFPAHGDDADTLLQRADVALYVAKDTHVGTAVYDPEQDQNDAARLALAGELRRAIAGDQLVVFFQPKADLASGRIVGAEALVRWAHPERGFIPPNDFVPIAERTGLIKPLTRSVLSAALSQCQAWASTGHDLDISVNLTIPDLLDLELPDHIAGLLARTGVRPGQLELEITETTILADPFRVRQVLDRLNEMGLRLAIDDFGTGYSSLAYLRRLPVQTIKIDRSFVLGMTADANDATIVRSTIDLGRNLGLDIVAEGVETRECWDALRDYGCTLAQGYLISRPVPAEEFGELLDEPALAEAAG
jgi:diguanylate cyclase (GGDEF)-like protein